MCSIFRAATARRRSGRAISRESGDGVTVEDYRGGVHAYEGGGERRQRRKKEEQANPAALFAESASIALQFNAETREKVEITARDTESFLHQFDSVRVYGFAERTKCLAPLRFGARTFSPPFGSAGADREVSAPSARHIALQIAVYQGSTFTAIKTRACLRPFPGSRSSRRSASRWPAAPIFASLPGLGLGSANISPLPKPRSIRSRRAT